MKISDKRNLQYLSGHISLKELVDSKKEINESLGMTITKPLLSGKALQAFTSELKRWKDVGFLNKWQKNRLFSKIKVYVKGIEKPYVINITGMAKKEDEEGNTSKAKFKSRLIGKVKSPFRPFHSFNNWGFYEIMEKLFDMVEDDIDKDKPQKNQGLDDEAAEKFENDLGEAMNKARRQLKVFQQIDNGNFTINMSEDSDGDGDALNEMALSEMAVADIKDVDLGGTPEEIAKAYVEKYESRMGKDFDTKAVGPMLTTLKKAGMEESKARKVQSAARELKKLPSPEEIKKARQKRASEARKEKRAEAKKSKEDNTENIKESILMNSGLLINEAKNTYKELLKNPDNKAYKDTDSKYALANLTTGDIYEVSDKKSDLSIEAGFSGQVGPDDKVVILDIKTGKTVKKLNGAK